MTPKTKTTLAVGGGVVVAGGLAAVLALRGKKATTTQPEGVATGPNYPNNTSGGSASNGTGTGSASTSGSTSGSSSGTGSATSSSGSGSATSSSGTGASAPGASGTSPYGNNPSAPSKPCPKGYAPKYVKGYGWTCAETTAEEQKNFQTSLGQIGKAGISISATGTTPVSGMTPEQQAKTTQAYLQKKYGGNYVIVKQNGSYLITPASRAASLDQLPNPAISADPTQPTINASELQSAIADAKTNATQYHVHYTVYKQPFTVKGQTTYQYVVLPEGESVPTGSTALYSTSSGTTSAGRQLLGTNVAATTTGTSGSATSTSKTATSSPGPSTPKLVSTSLKYLYNENSCLFTYEKIGHYSDGSTRNLGKVTQQQGNCASKPTVKYTYRHYLYNANGYYHYAIMAVYTNGKTEQIGTVTTKGA